MKQFLYKIFCYILRFFTRIYLWRKKPLVIGVTGSVGKTSCRQIIAQVLEQIQSEKKVYSSPKNYNSELGIIFSIFTIEEYEPGILSLLKLTFHIAFTSIFGKKKYDILVAEYGIDTPGDMDFLLSVMRPNIGILTKLDSVHSENFPRGVTELWEDKFKLLIASKDKVYFNGQDEFSNKNEYLLSDPYEKIFIKTPKSKLVTSEGGIRQEFIYKRKDISINLVGEENIVYTILALDIAKDLKIKTPEKSYDFQYTLQPGRFSIFERNGNILIDSSYNAGPESMKKVISNTQLIQKELYPKHKTLYVLGDMRDIGEARQSAHEGISALVADASAVMLVGPGTYTYTLPKLKEEKFKGDIHSSLSSREVGKYLKKYLRDNAENSYVILFKGSQNTIFTEEALAPQLLVSQQKNLPRQSEDWKKKKDDFFENL